MAEDGRGRGRGLLRRDETLTETVITPTEMNVEDGILNESARIAHHGAMHPIALRQTGHMPQDKELHKGGEAGRREVEVEAAVGVGVGQVVLGIRIRMLSQSKCTSNLGWWGSLLEEEERHCDE